MQTNQQQPYYTLGVISDQPADTHSPAYQHFKQSIPLFADEAIYVYSFKENKLVFTHGWKQVLGYADHEITLPIIVTQTDPMHAAAAYEINDKAVAFILSKRERLEEYSFVFDVRKIHKDGRLIPTTVRVGVLSTENGHVKEAIGRFQVNRNLRFGKVLRYAAYGPEKNLYEEELNKSLFEHFVISEKEKEAVQLVANGYSFKQIADKLGVSQSAIEKRIIPLYKRFGVKSLPHLISFAYENFILP